MFSATELNLQEAGGPERQCDHLPVREQGDIRFYEFSQKPYRNPFFWVWKSNLVGGLQGVYTPPPLATPPATPLKSSEGGRGERNKEHWDPGGRD